MDTSLSNYDHRHAYVQATSFVLSLNQLVLIRHGSYCAGLGRGDASKVSCHRNSSLLRRFQVETGRCTIAIPYFTYQLLY